MGARSAGCAVSMGVREDKSRPGSFVAQITCKTKDGVSRRVSARGSSAEEAMAAAEEKCRNIGRQVGRAKRISVGDLVAAFVNHSTQVNKARTAEEYRRVLVRATARYKRTPLLLVDQKMVAAMISDGSVVTLPGRGKKRTTTKAAARRAHTYLRVMFVWAAEMGHIGHNPAEFVRAPKLPPKERVYWDVEQRQRFLAACRSPVYGPFLTVILLLGLRVGEAQALHKLDVTRTAMTVRRTWDAQDKTITLPKTGKVRILPMPAGLLGLLEARWAAHPDSLFALPNNEGGMISYHNARRYLNGILDELPDLPRVTLHDLRGLAATAWAESGRVAVKEIQAMLGHSSSRLAYEVYVRAAPVERMLAPVSLSDALGAGQRQLLDSWFKGQSGSEEDADD